MVGKRGISVGEGRGIQLQKILKYGRGKFEKNIHINILYHNDLFTKSLKEIIKINPFFKFQHS